MQCRHLIFCSGCRLSPWSLTTPLPPPAKHIQVSSSIKHTFNYPQQYCTLDSTVQCNLQHVHCGAHGDSTMWYAALSQCSGEQYICKLVWVQNTFPRKHIVYIKARRSGRWLVVAGLLNTHCIVFDTKQTNWPLSSAKQRKSVGGRGRNCTKLGWHSIWI